MAKYVKQFRYYSDLPQEDLMRVSSMTAAELKKIKNYPYDITRAALSLNASTLFRSCLPIKKLGIQALPGTKFYLNFSPMTNPIIIGATGRFELDLSNSAGVITDLYFDKTSLQIINDTPSAYLIIDMVCEEE